ncbi:extracellular solute-binding protein [Paenibacillus eucommiae]|uniref:Aldouronate transport system substrate-binding protein n=1 Tax=Paenibacillus eucommiae TaxID=1355755 RepID=A0ABS4J3B2_9BACL|nr:extracellular solute-binding protein [Paenibacillus eucommiae]MBP1994290.1 putative aldouronate transport system substrate-binding protein [Paenibacillus eucommiae]
MRKKKILTMIIPLVLTLAMVVSGCSKSAGEPTAGTGVTSPSPKVSAAPTDISIMLIQFTPESLPADNPVLKEIEKRTNTNMKITWVPKNNFDEKVSVTLAAGDLPDMMQINSVFAPLVKQMAKQGLFWDITPYIKDYKNLSALPKDTWENSKIYGKNYGVPRVRPLDGGGGLPMLRMDWLNKLNLKMPETLDELYIVLKAFAENDPDGNGKADTIPFAGEVTPESMGRLTFVEQVYNGAGTWKLKNGKLVHTALEPGTRDALIWLNKAYKEKLLDPDLAIRKSTQTEELIMTGKSGATSGALNATWKYAEPLRKTVPEADIAPVTYLIGPDGKFSIKEGGFAGMFVIPKRVPEEKMKQILAFMDYGTSEEGADLANYGFEGVHYTKKDGFINSTEQATKDMVASNVLGQMFTKFAKYSRAFLTGIPKDMYDRNIKVIDERAKISVSDPAIGLESETYLKVGKDFDKKLQDLKTKIIIGKEDIAAYDAMVTKLKADTDFQKIITEMNEAYQAKNASK